MPHSTRFRQPPNTKKATTTDDLPPDSPPDSPPEQTPDDTGTDTAVGTDTAAADTDTDTATETAAADATTGDLSAAATDSTSDAAAPDEDVVRGGWRDRYPAVARTVASAVTVSAAVLVLAALLLPNQLTRLTPGEFLRIPVEGIFGAALLLLLPPKARRVAAVVAGVGLGLRTLLNCLDMGFYSVLARPFDPVLDWILFDDAESFLRDSIGQAGATAAVIGVVVLVLGLLVLMTLAVVRLSRLMVRHSAVATRTTLVLGTVWITCAALGVQLAGVPVASTNTADLVQDSAQRLRASLADQRVFAKEARKDAFRDTPPDQLLTGLRGKDVLFTFIESYGRSAIADPAMASQIDAVLKDGTKRLHKAGFASRSAWLTSPTAGGGSWLAHSTFMSGLWINNQQRYRTVTSSDRMPLTDAFKRSGAWRTAGIMPGVTRSWPEGKFYGLDHVYDTHHLGYKGPQFSWSRVPDQFSLSAFERLEHGKRHDKPLMSEIILVSSHNPWAPIPKMIGWDELGDGSVYHGIQKAGKDPKEVWKDPAQVRTEYRRAIEYSLHSLVSYMEKYGNKNTVLVFLGDHQPVPTVTGENASRDVPVALVAHDPAVLDRISGWGWQKGLKPGPKTPVWRMDTFRDRFLTAYGPRPGATPPRAAH
ncbi:sulfatase [Streptomyces nigrescens]|uniref:Sulfatase n=1 Tax=Streptomyces nigrescens TaxID=1920 RepID=A0ABY7J104_STRNI|nr:sulfatase [Streptomyces nigrescens]WAU04936.1 sulfatase [Streptomyces nigrescens]